MIQQAINNKEREISLAYDIELTVPPLVAINRLPKAEAHAFLADPGYIEIIPNKLLMLDPSGVQCKFIGWYNGEEFTSFFIAADNDRLLDGDRGPICGSTCTTVFAGKSALMEPYFRRLSKAMSGDDYIGLVCLHVAINDSSVIYKHIGFGVSEHILHAISCMAGTDIGLINESALDNMSGFGVCQPLYTHPNYFNDELIGRELQLAEIPYVVSEDGEYLLTAAHTSISAAWKKLYRMAEVLPHTVCFRQDGDVAGRKVFSFLKIEKYI